jgi:hypothetical protein
VTAATLRSCGLTSSGHDDAELREHVLDALHGEGRLARLVAGAVEADDEPVADELVRAHARDGREVLDAVGVRGRRDRGAEEDERGQQSHLGILTAGTRAC